MKRRALITGITGQDGAYLASYLLSLGYEVYGTTRDSHDYDSSRLEKLIQISDIRLVSMTISDFGSVLKVITDVRPNEIYNLAGQTSVGLSFEQPIECHRSIADATLNFLEAIRITDRNIRLFSAGSTECFGDTLHEPATEETRFCPESPYAIAKCTAFWHVANYRKAYGLYACTGILSNHESPLRHPRFVTQKIVTSAKRILDGTDQCLRLGSLSIIRDWGWAADYVIAMHQMLQADYPSDFNIATGSSHTLEEFVDLTFRYAGLSYKDYVEIDENIGRPSDIHQSNICIDKIKRELGWEPVNNFKDVIKKMYNSTIY